MPELAELDEQILSLVKEAENKRRRPHDLHDDLTRSHGVSRSAVQRALNDLVRQGKLIFTYRDPCSYVELPWGSLQPPLAPANEYEHIKEQILTLVRDAEKQRLRPYELERGFGDSLGDSNFTIQQAINDLVREGKLLFTYRDPCSYVETPESAGETLVT